MRIGELARAAEALERAAAAERKIAGEARKAARETGLTEEEARQLQDEQENVKQVAARIAEGVRPSAAEPADRLDKAVAASDDIARAIAEAGKKGEAARPAEVQSPEKAEDSETGSPMKGESEPGKSEPGKAEPGKANAPPRCGLATAPARDSAPPATTARR